MTSLTSQYHIIFPSEHQAEKPHVQQLQTLRTHLFGMIRKLKSGEYRLYSRKKDAKSGKRKNLGTFSSRAAAEKHERAVQFFKRH
jgi:hypothetical protein